MANELDSESVGCVPQEEVQSDGVGCEVSGHDD